MSTEDTNDQNERINEGSQSISIEENTQDQTSSPKLIKKIKVKY